MPSITRLTPADHRRVPWKNGGGVTTELAVEPAADGRFVWRVSIADVVEPGPFSAFPGYDRLIAVVEGEGMRLSVDGEPPVERRRLDPAFAFPGEAPVWCEPIAGPIRDVNLILDRASATGVLTLLAGLTVHRAAGDALLVHALGGTLTVTREGGETLTVPAGHSLLLRDAAALVEAPAGAEGVCAEVRRR
ncbi:environmental stress-induced protein Ves [Azospirillum lipoferum]|uniref:HutD family protein n=1 Tax=Azospirillum lipoferum TaxID=193 RepID=A0A5A9GQ03_AZOLI|nr:MULTISPECIES: HutD family protein [Azospirillum]KAA0596517.1 HutD family protein [Azospirillum lipoferum]MCP1610517.1 environmental stress-induced protein Ves [Azospirillum lipoferum]MDW5538040.1 HutD family protein [Azospirillum sp. NL1]